MTAISWAMPALALQTGLETQIINSTPTYKVMHTKKSCTNKCSANTRLQHVFQSYPNLTLCFSLSFRHSMVGMNLICFNLKMGVEEFFFIYNRGRYYINKCREAFLVFRPRNQANVQILVSTLVGQHFSTTD